MATFWQRIHMRPGQLHRVLAYVRYMYHLNMLHAPGRRWYYRPFTDPRDRVPTSVTTSTPTTRIQLDAYRIYESYSSIPRTGQQQSSYRPAKRGQPQTKDLPTPPLSLCTQLAPPSAPCAVPAAAALHSFSHCSIAWLSILLTWRRIVQIVGANWR